MSRIITRSGITPVGSPHYRINRLRYHLLAYAISRRAKLDGFETKYIIRCDDTNAESSDRSFLYAYLDVLREIGVSPDMWPQDVDDSGHSLFQSERTDIYRHHIDRLISERLAYVDTTGATFFDTASFEERFRSEVRDGRICVSDLSMGTLSVDISTSLKDRSGRKGYEPFPLTRSNGSPLFNIASPVDDALLGITHVVRDRGKLNVLLNQEMVRIALGFPKLTYVHVPLIVDDSGKKLVFTNSYGEATYQNFIAHGILSRGLISYLLSTVTGPSERFYASIDDFAKLADFENIHVANTAFDSHLLETHNRRAIEISQEQEYSLALQKYLSTSNSNRLGLLVSNPDLGLFLFKAKRDFTECSRMIACMLEPQYGEVKPELKELVRLLLKEFCEVSARDKLLPDRLLSGDTINSFGVKKAEYFQSVRFILTGQYHGYDLQEIVQYLFAKGLLGKRFGLARKQLLGR